MIFLIVILFYSIDFYCADNFQAIVTNYLDTVNSTSVVSNYAHVIDTFHTTLKTQSPDNQKNMLESLIQTYGKKIIKSECAIEKIVELMKQSVVLTHSRLKVQYEKILNSQSDDLIGENFFNTDISFYYEYSAYSINPNDQLYYQIQYIKDLNISSLPLKQLLIISLVENTQSVLFKEHNGDVSRNVVFKIACYYENSITKPLLDKYFQDKYIYNKKNDNDFDKIKLIEQQKILLMSIAYVRGFFGQSSFVLCAKDPDGDCGNYCIDICYTNSEEKYGAFNVPLLLSQNVDTFSNEQVDELYPSHKKIDEIKNKSEKKSIIRRIWNVSFYLFNIIFKIFYSLLTRKNQFQSDNVHPSINPAQHEKIKLQIADFKKCDDKNKFMQSLYTDKSYSDDYPPCWFKYWHLKEALVADLLKIKIRIFVGIEQDLVEITQAEPCYDEQSREVCVWTDNKACHDSELVPFYYYGLMAKALRFENRYFNLNYKSPDYLAHLEEKIEEYKKNWICNRV